jgi:copper chaperone
MSGEVMSVETLILSVPGMTCGHCESAVKTEVGAVAGVAEVVVDLASKDVTVTGTGLDRDAIVEAIDEAGFDVG